MKRRDDGLLFLLGLLIVLAAARFQAAPGYMDADYYYAGGVRLASGAGFSEPFLWNYLDDPVGLPHPSYTYWMPLASLLSAAGMLLSGSTDFNAARLLFFPLAALLPVVTAHLAYRFSGRRRNGWIAGGLALAPGFYLVYWGITETFVLYMLLGSLFLMLAPAPQAEGRPVLLRAAALGLLAGGMHLTRADGALWLVLALGVVFLWPVVRRAPLKRMIGTLLVVLAGYLWVMFPWYARNLLLYGAPFAPGGSRALWLTYYDQTYAYPAGRVNFAAWWAAGLPAALQARLDALWMNLKTALGVQGEIFLLPLMLVGLWRVRQRPEVRLAGLGWLLTLLVMSIIFPFAGARGGFLHSGAAFQLVWWAAAPLGLEAFIGRGVRWRNWNLERSAPIFGSLMILVCVVMSLALFSLRVMDAKTGELVWQKSWGDYVQAAALLDDLHVPADTPVMVNNPPGFYAATGRPALVITDGGVEPLLAAARRYGGRYVILERNHGPALNGLYKTPTSLPGLRYLRSQGEMHFFAVEGP